MKLTHQLILSPSETTRRMLVRRMFLKDEESNIQWGAVLLVQGGVAELFAAVDVGSKAASVTARELLGNCPQHINTVAFIGSVADVKQVQVALSSRGMIA